MGGRRAITINTRKSTYSSYLVDNASNGGVERERVDARGVHARDIGARYNAHRDSSHARIMRPRAWYRLLWRVRVVVSNRQLFHYVYNVRVCVCTYTFISVDGVRQLINVLSETSGYILV